MGNALGRGWGVRIPNDTYTHSPIGAASSQAGYPPAYNIYHPSGTCDITFVDEKT